MNSKATAFIALLFILSGCSSSNTPDTQPGSPSENNSALEPERPELLPGAEQIREKIAEYLNSPEEPEIIRAIWASPFHLVVGMKDEGGSYDGWAGSICIIAGEHGLITTGTRIEVVDYKTIKNKYNWRVLGYFYCKEDGSPPIEVDFTKDVK